MRKYAATMLLLLTLLAAAQAGVKVKGDQSYKPFDPIILKASDVTSAKASFLWDVDGAAQVVEAGDTLYVWAPLGTYTVRLTAIDFDAKKVERAKFTFKVEGDVPVPPTPGPTPGPGPGPSPGPLAKAWIVIIEATAEAKADRGQWVRDQDLLKYIKDKGWRLRHSDVNAKDATGNTPTDLVPYIKRASGKAMPQVYVVGDDGKVRYEGALPATPADMLAILKKFGG